MLGGKIGSFLLWSHMHVAVQRQFLGGVVEARPCLHAREQQLRLAGSLVDGTKSR